MIGRHSAEAPWLHRETMLMYYRALEADIHEFGNFTDVIAISPPETCVYDIPEQQRTILTNEDIFNATYEDLIVEGQPSAFDVDEVTHRRNWSAFLAENAWWIGMGKRAAGNGFTGGHVETANPKDLFGYMPWNSASALLIANYGREEYGIDEVRNLGLFSWCLLEFAPKILRQEFSRFVFLEPIEDERPPGVFHEQDVNTILVDNRLITDPGRGEERDVEWIQKYYQLFVARIFKEIFAESDSVPEMPELPTEGEFDMLRRIRGPLDRKLPVPTKITLRG